MQPAYVGPTFTKAPEGTIDEIARARRDLRPILIRGAIRAWPAFERWSFEYLADQCAGVSTKVQGGLIEQGASKPVVEASVTNYVRGLGQRSEVARGFVSDERLAALGPDEPFQLDWSRMAFEPADYLQQWEFLSQVPHLQEELWSRQMWPAPRYRVTYAFVGPENTLTGLHWDLNHNWFCQVRGTKEALLFPQDQAEYLGVADRYEAGAVLAEIDISRLEQTPEISARFARAKGWYARLEPGDALLIPRGVWHGVVSRTASISVGIFGLSPAEFVFRGAAILGKEWLHQHGWYGTHACSCHPPGTFSKQGATA